MGVQGAPVRVGNLHNTSSLLAIVCFILIATLMIRKVRGAILIGIIATTAYLLRSVLNVTYGPTIDKVKNLVDARAIEVVPMVVLLGLIILIGVYPTILSDPLQNTLQSLLTSIGG